jgi:hypothetical protein
MITADVFDVFPELLNSQDAKVCKWTAEILGTLASHDFGLERVLTSNLCTTLVSLLQRVSIPHALTSMLIIWQG